MGRWVALLVTDLDLTPIRFSMATLASSSAKPRPSMAAVEPLLLSPGRSPALIVAPGQELDSFDFEGLEIPTHALCDQPGAWTPSPNPASARILMQAECAQHAPAMLERVETALACAVDDRRVRQIAATPGLDTNVSLSFADFRPDDIGAGELAARLWQILSPPAARPERASDSIGVEALAWPAPLMPFQEDGVRALLDMKRLLLADDMGLGKTIQAIAALRIRRQRGELGPVLVVAPTSLLDQWRRELARWAPEVTAIVVRGTTDERSWKWRALPDVTLTSYGVLRSDGWRPEVKIQWDTVVLDEAQRIKNRIETSDAVKCLRRSRSWALTGTPVENREDELASIMEFVDHDGQLPLKRFSPSDALRQRHRELQLRRRKVDVLADLPPKLVSNQPIELTPAQRASYDRAERDGVVFLRSLGADVTIVHVLELITRLKQCCNADPKTGASCKLDEMMERLEELTARGHRAVVFSQYASATSGVHLAASRLAKFQPLTLTGQIPVAERPYLIDSFRKQSRHQVLIVSLGVGGVGLNLQEASYVFHLDRWWNPAVERQAEDRVHRIGQTVRVHVFKYTCVNTIEERIDSVLKAKQALFDELVDDVSLDLATRLSREELLGLFDL